MKLDRFGSAIAHVDLGARSWQMKPAPEEWVEKYVGARGLGVRYVLENGPDVDPLSPDNLLCFLNGPLTGSEANMSGRWACVTKSPLTGTVTDSHQGGWTAARVRWAGFDGVIFEGAASEPTYVVLHQAAQIRGEPRDQAAGAWVMESVPLEDAIARRASKSWAVVWAACHRPSWAL